jgi:type IV pilus assembly protein PilV
MLMRTTANLPAGPRARESAQYGVFLLEALIAILIVSFGILGIVGLQARSISYTNDAEYRGEAVYLTDAVLANMWVDSPTTLISKYQSAPGIGYLDFQSNVFARLPGAAAIAGNPAITIVNPSVFALDPNSFDVTVTVRWHAPSDAAGVNHSHTATATISRN